MQAAASLDFLWSLLALATFLRLSLMKAAHAVVASAAYRKSRSNPGAFRPALRQEYFSGYCQPEKEYLGSSSG
jgi:hypothetical protein